MVFCHFQESRQAGEVFAVVVQRPPAGKIVLTYEDYFRFPSDGKRYDLLEGEVFMVPAPSPRH